MITYELKELLPGSHRLVSSHATREAAEAALPDGAAWDEAAGRYVTEDGRAFVVEAVA